MEYSYRRKYPKNRWIVSLGPTFPDFVKLPGLEPTLLEHEEWKKRSFGEIRKRPGGFDEDDLGKILVRAGAVRFQKKGEKVGSDEELWGLLSRNEGDL